MALGSIVLVSSVVKWVNLQLAKDTSNKHRLPGVLQPKRSLDIKWDLKLDLSDNLICHQPCNDLGENAS